MILQPSENPGSHERHLKRRHNNILFEERQVTMTQDEQMEAQQKDHDTLLEFMQEFQQALEDTVKLKPTSDSDVILKLKEQLDKLYEASCVVPDEQTETQEAIKKLLTIIMASIRNGAGNDPTAHKELDQEETARHAHFEMLQSSLVADLLNPASPIIKEDLLPTLLSAAKEDLALAVQLFDDAQLKLLIEEGTALLNRLAKHEVEIKEAAENLVFIEGYVEYLKQCEAETISKSVS
jgi:hypothetical protein